VNLFISTGRFSENVLNCTTSRTDILKQLRFFALIKEISRQYIQWIELI